MNKRSSKEQDPNILFQKNAENLISTYSSVFDENEKLKEFQADLKHIMSFTLLDKDQLVQANEENQQLIEKLRNFLLAEPFSNVVANEPEGIDMRISYKELKEIETKIRQRHTVLKQNAKKNAVAEISHMEGPLSENNNEHINLTANFEDSRVSDFSTVDESILQRQVERNLKSIELRNKKSLANSSIHKQKDIKIESPHQFSFDNVCKREVNYSFLWLLLIVILLYLLNLYFALVRSLQFLM